MRLSRRPPVINASLTAVPSRVLVASSYNHHENEKKCCCWGHEGYPHNTTAVQSLCQGRRLDSGQNTEPASRNTDCKQTNPPVPPRMDRASVTPSTAVTCICLLFSRKNNEKRAVDVVLTLLHCEKNSFQQQRLLRYPRSRYCESKYGCDKYYQNI